MNLGGYHLKKQRIFNNYILKIILCIVITLSIVSPVAPANVSAAEKVNLNITASNCNVTVRCSNTGKYKYEYDASKFIVTKNKKGPTINITIKAKKDASIELMDQVSIFVPKQAYNKITAVSNKAGLSLPKLNANYDITSNEGAVSVTVPKNFNKTVKYTGYKSSGGIDMRSITSDFKITMKIDTSAISLPKDFPKYKIGSKDYMYQTKKGTAKFIIDIHNCSFTISK